MNQLDLFPQQAYYSSADFSPCRTWRYTLWRGWADDWRTNYAMFVGLNPSTADEMQDDPTIRRCIRFCKDLGYSGYCMTNIFGFRATDPRDMKAAVEPIGPENDDWIQRCAADARIVIAAWGTHGSYLNRGPEVANMIENLHCLRITKDGHPAHPLYLPADLRPVKFAYEKL